MNFCNMKMREMSKQRAATISKNYKKLAKIKVQIDESPDHVTEFIDEYNATITEIKKKISA